MYMPMRQPFLKLAAMVIRMPICNGPISRLFLNILSYVCVPNVVLVSQNEQ